MEPDRLSVERQCSFVYCTDKPMSISRLGILYSRTLAMALMVFACIHSWIMQATRCMHMVVGRSYTCVGRRVLGGSSSTLSQSIEWEIHPIRRNWRHCNTPAYVSHFGAIYGSRGVAVQSFLRQIWSGFAATMCWLIWLNGTISWNYTLNLPMWSYLLECFEGFAKCPQDKTK